MDLERRSQPFGKTPALLLVDLINGFTDPACPLGSACDDVVAANRVLLDAFRTRDLPVFFTTTLYRDVETASVFRARIPALNVLTPESRWVAVDDRLKPLPDEPVIEKNWASAFFDTDLATKLRAAQVDTLVVTGLTTSGCIRASALDGLQNNFPVFIPREAVGDRNQAAHDANLFDLHAKYADVTFLDEILNNLDLRD